MLKAMAQNGPLWNDVLEVGTA